MKQTLKHLKMFMMVENCLIKLDAQKSVDLFGSSGKHQLLILFNTEEKSSFLRKNLTKFHHMESLTNFRLSKNTKESTLQFPRMDFDCKNNLTIFIEHQHAND